MTDPIPPAGLEITPTAIKLQLQGFLRLAVAGIAGSLVTAAANKLHLPLLTTIWGAQGDQVVGVIVGAIMFALMAAWQWARVQLVNSRWWHLATDPRVPDDLVRPAAPVQPKEKTT